MKHRRLYKGSFIIFSDDPTNVAIALIGLFLLFKRIYDYVFSSNAPSFPPFQLTPYCPTTFPSLFDMLLFNSIDSS